MKKQFFWMLICLTGFSSAFVAQPAMSNLPSQTLYAQAKGDNYTTYFNERQSFYISYPSHIFVLKKPESAYHYGGEQSFVSKDGRASMFISSFYKADFSDIGWNGVPLKQLYAEALQQKGRTVTYKASGNNWYVVSGMQDGKVFYEKFILASDRKIEFNIRYPKSQEKIYDAITEKVVKSIKY
jgi:hypothetical protein